MNPNRSSVQDASQWHEKNRYRRIVFVYCRGRFALALSFYFSLRKLLFVKILTLASSWFLSIASNNPNYTFLASCFLNELRGKNVRCETNVAENLAKLINFSNVLSRHAVENPVWKLEVEKKNLVIGLFSFNFCNFSPFFRAPHTLPPPKKKGFQDPLNSPTIFKVQKKKKGSSGHRMNE